MEAHLSRLLQSILSLFLLVQLTQAAPGQPGTHVEREAGDDARPAAAALANPFGLGDEERRLLKNYIRSTLKDGEGAPEINTWEQEVFFLFRLYDYDRSGYLDGLEMMKLLSDYNSHHTPGAHTNEQVVSMVDFLLQTQDPNQDGLLAPLELLSPPLPHTQHQETVPEEKLPHVGTDHERMKAAVEVEELHEKFQPQEQEEQQQLEVKIEGDEPVKQMDVQDGQQVPESHAEEQKHKREVPVHQGQPEI